MKQLRPVGIIGTGKYVPERILTNSDLEKIVDTNDEWIVSRTGIRERHIAAPEQATSDLAYEAALKALESAGMKAEELDLIIVATVTPDSTFPSTACILQDKLGAKGLRPLTCRQPAPVSSTVWLRQPALSRTECITMRLLLVLTHCRASRIIQTATLVYCSVMVPAQSL